MRIIAETTSMCKSILDPREQRKPKCILNSRQGSCFIQIRAKHVSALESWPQTQGHEVKWDPQRGPCIIVDALRPKRFRQNTFSAEVDFLYIYIYIYVYYYSATGTLNPKPQALICKQPVKSPRESMRRSSQAVSRPTDRGAKR